MCFNREYTQWFESTEEADSTLFQDVKQSSQEEMTLDG